MAQHFIHEGRSETYACGANAVGRRNTPLDTNPELTTCPRCRVELARAKREDDQPTPSKPPIITGELGQGRGAYLKLVTLRERQVIRDAATKTPPLELSTDQGLASIPGVEPIDLSAPAAQLNVGELGYGRGWPLKGLAANSTTQPTPNQED